MKVIKENNSVYLYDDNNNLISTSDKINDILLYEILQSNLRQEELLKSTKKSTYTAFSYKDVSSGSY